MPLCVDHGSVLCSFWRIAARALRPSNPQRMARHRKELAKKTVEAVDGYDALFADVVRVIEDARRAAARSVNAVMTATYWLVGRRIVELEQGGRARAGYGEALLDRLSSDLTARF